VASKKKKPVFGDKFGIPTRKDIDKPLVIGSAFFGLGWGLVGFCPGPALSALSTGMAEPLIFTAAMVAGMAAHKALKLP
jgi:uncharacterized membrane protein YedE/YeeE